MSLKNPVRLIDRLCCVDFCYVPSMKCADSPDFSLSRLSVEYTQEGQADNKQPSNPRITGEGAHMVPLDQVRQIIDEAIIRERDEKRMAVEAVQAAVQRGTDPDTELVDATLIGLSKDLFPIVMS